MPRRKEENVKRGENPTEGNDEFFASAVYH
jgi:hypothetical protein